MKIVCGCGNEMNLIEPEDSEDHSIDEEGIYVIKDKDTFDFWERHDQVGIVCNKCEKAIWMFC